MRLGTYIYSGFPPASRDLAASGQLKQLVDVGHDGRRGGLGQAAGERAVPVESPLGHVVAVNQDVYAANFSFSA
jgi:hypothetical protein